MLTSTSREFPLPLLLNDFSHRDTLFLELMIRIWLTGKWFNYSRALNGEQHFEGFITSTERNFPVNWEWEECFEWNLLRFFFFAQFWTLFGYIFDYAINQIILINGCDEVKNPFQIFISFITRHWKNIIIEDHSWKSLPPCINLWMPTTVVISTFWFNI